MGFLLLAYAFVSSYFSELVNELKSSANNNQQFNGGIPDGVEHQEFIF